MDCDSLTATTALGVGVNGNPTGQVTLDFNVASEIGVFRGVGPNDQFNCLAPADNPNGMTVNVPNLPAGGTAASIDRTVPSWGSTLPLAPGIGGGTAPCMIRIGYQSVNLDTTSDKFFFLALPQDASNTPPPIRTATTVPNPNLPITAPVRTPPTTPTTAPATAPAESSPTTSGPNHSATASDGSSPATAAGNPLSPTTSTVAAHSTGSSATGPGTTGTGTTKAGGAVGARGAGSASSAQDGRSTESVSSPTTVQLAAASTSARTTNSEAYWYLLAGAAICALGVAAAELRNSGGGRDGLARRDASRRGAGS